MTLQNHQNNFLSIIDTPKPVKIKLEYLKIVEIISGQSLSRPQYGNFKMLLLLQILREIIRGESKVKKLPF